MSSDVIFKLGQVARVTLAVLDYSRVAADPGTLRLKVKDPAGQVTTLTLGAGVVKDAVGNYHADVALTTAGAWYYRWEGDAPNPGSDEGQITVRRSAVI